MIDPKEKQALKTRTVGKKTRQGAFDNLRQLPHPMVEFLGFDLPATPVTAVPPVTPVTPVPQAAMSDADAAPKRDFARVANSVVRDAIPAGLFTGKRKQLYDYLYSQTRGAIIPKRAVRLPTGRVMRGAGMTRHTYRAHLQSLVASGLVAVEEKAGEHGGNLFTVFLPDEIGKESVTTRVTRVTPVTVQDRHMVQGSEVDRSDRGLSVAAVETSAGPKTSLKTNTIDDDALTPLRALERELTGKVSPATNWIPLFELLADELKAASARTASVSDVAAFFTEHLRRCLAKPDAPRREGKRTTTAAAPLVPEDVAPPAPDDVEEFERARAELDGK